MFDDSNNFWFLVVLLISVCLSFSYCSSEQTQQKEIKLKTLEKAQSAIDKWNGSLPLGSTGQIQDIITTLRK